MPLNRVQAQLTKIWKKNFVFCFGVFIGQSVRTKWKGLRCTLVCKKVNMCEYFLQTACHPWSGWNLQLQAQKPLRAASEHHECCLSMQWLELINSSLVSCLFKCRQVFSLDLSLVHVLPFWFLPNRITNQSYVQNLAVIMIRSWTSITFVNFDAFSQCWKPFHCTWK